LNSLDQDKLSGAYAKKYAQKTADQNSDSEFGFDKRFQTESGNADKDKNGSNKKRGFTLGIFKKSKESKKVPNSARNGDKSSGEFKVKFKNTTLEDF